MAHALDLARRGPAHGPNPQVGCVILAADTADATRTAGTPGATSAGGAEASRPRRVLAVGWHRGAGTPHAEADALARASASGVDVRGATAVVTLEPCNHTGRTGPCAQALLDAGVAEVVVSVGDPNPVASGGMGHLRSHGVAVRTGLLADEGEELLRVWLTSVRAGRPFVTLKTATSLDGCVAAADGSSRWITGPQSRAHAHTVRATVDAILVGTGTLLADDPTLTARPPVPEGEVGDGVPEPAVHQPLRVVVGERAVADDARVRGGDGRFVHLATHDVHEVLARLAALEVRHVLVEGGPTVATAFVTAGVVDEIHSYVAPVLVGDGRRAVGALGGQSIDDAVRWSTSTVERLGEDVLLVARAVRPPP
nr:bifunctional diaminohydroxyphosphoribosylaminopyrimidine deaminase/5-amino-6-(5-phosphoribosylamino)uracil reductase RibD [Sanguibacter keddieii]